MRELKYTSIVKEFDSIDELSEQCRQLMQKAVNSRSHAYAPYSKFYVGAALLLDDGTIVQGNNQENAAYPSGLCAERTALFAANANYPGRKVRKIAISASSDEFEVDIPVYPCGACRQVIAEYEYIAGQAIEIIMMGTRGKVHVVEGLINLMPVIFNADNLKPKNKTMS